MPIFYGMLKEFSKGSQYALDRVDAFVLRIEVIDELLHLLTANLRQVSGAKPGKKIEPRHALVARPRGKFTVCLDVGSEPALTVGVKGAGRVLVKNAHVS
jgi:hypothetical protein